MRHHIHMYTLISFNIYFHCYFLIRLLFYLGYQQAYACKLNVASSIRFPLHARPVWSTGDFIFLYLFQKWSTLFLPMLAIVRGQWDSYGNFISFKICGPNLLKVTGNFINFKICGPNLSKVLKEEGCPCMCSWSECA